MNVSESKITMIKFEIMKILVSKIKTIFHGNRKNQKNEDSQIIFSLTTISPCKNE